MYIYIIDGMRTVLFGVIYIILIFVYKMHKLCELQVNFLDVAFVCVCVCVFVCTRACMHVCECVCMLYM